MTRRVTIILLVAFVVVLAGWDIFAAAEPTAGDTISELVLATARRHPVLPFVVGIICGHLFWPQGETQ